jgi:hypothetical protein
MNCNAPTHETNTERKVLPGLLTIVALARSLVRRISEATTARYVRLVEDDSGKRAEHIDFKVVFAAAAEVCPVVAVQLALRVLFGIKPESLYRFRPNSASDGTRLKFPLSRHGTHEHSVDVSTPEQREWLDRAKQVAQEHADGIVALPSVRSQLGLERHFYRVCHDIGLTFNGRFRATPSTLRKEYSIRRVTEVARKVLADEAVNAKKGRSVAKRSARRTTAALPDLNSRQDWPRPERACRAVFRMCTHAAAAWGRRLRKCFVPLVGVERVRSFLVRDCRPAGHIDLEEVFTAVARHSELAAAELALYVFFGIGFGESFSFAPDDDDWGSHVRFVQGGRQRVQMVRTNQERTWLNRAARLVKPRPHKPFRVRVESQDQTDTRYWQVLCWSVGLTEDGRFRATPSMLRKEYGLRRSAALRLRT